jgi:hypothetical protein
LSFFPLLLGFNVGCGIGVYVPIFGFVAYLTCVWIFVSCVYFFLCAFILNLVSILTHFKVFFFLNNFFLLCRISLDCIKLY